MKVERIIKRLEELKPILREKYKVVKIGVFGSVARGEDREESDIDILVVFSEPIGLKFFDLVELLEKVLERKVDLVSDKAISPYIKPYIDKEVIFI